MDPEDAELVEELFTVRAHALAEWRQLRAKAEELRHQASEKWHEAQRVSPATVADKFDIPHDTARALAQKVERRVRAKESRQ